ncbi:AMP-binding enzyme, partial [Mycobacterium avium]
MVQLRPPSTTDPLVEHLRERSARYALPTEVAIVAALPRTPSGNADLAAVRRSVVEAPTALPHHARCFLSARSDFRP